MDSIRFEPSISATFAIDRNPSGAGGDLFADMLGEQLKKRAEAERPEPPVRRRPQADRPIQDEDRPAARRAPIVIKHAHEFNDTATTARDVTPNREVQPTLPAPARDRPVCADDGTAPETVEGEDQETGQEEPATLAPQLAAEAVAEPADQIVVAVAVADPQAPTVIDDQVQTATELPEAMPAIAPAVPELVEPAADPVTDAGTPPDAAPAAAAETEPQPEIATPPAGFVAELAASLDNAAIGLMDGGDAAAIAESARILASADPATLTTHKVAAPAPAEASQAAAVELAAKITPEAPRPSAETKARPAPRAVPGAEIKAQSSASRASGNQGATHQPPQIPAAAQVPAQAATQAATQAAPVAARGESPADGFDGAFPGDGAAVPGWTVHLAQGAAAKRPDFIAQLRQHLQELPAHEQVAVNIQRAAREGAGRVTIQLSPAELGKIHVKLEIDEEKRVTAAVTVEKPSTLELLQRDVKALERALQEAGLKMDGNDLSFNLGHQDGKESSQEMRQSVPAGFGNGSGETQAEGDIPASQAAALVDTAAGLVNVQI